MAVSEKSPQPGSKISELQIKIYITDVKNTFSKMMT